MIVPVELGNSPKLSLFCIISVFFESSFSVDFSKYADEIEDLGQYSLLFK